ncbi:FtsK/SpoIIIE domain-containing protein [Arthrobacter sp. MYb227]|uniref:FtsK/SpoIIIE domain-containing protein n=1 Tax=Arthrobacter sp. MYb227 TaxID=1848601 RepID=UPI0015E3B349|nr:FtsK/SpoIIIE domain-containing protein [Arthrobacter sp. MYb227]
MARKVLIRLVSDDQRRCLLIEVQGTGECTGAAFCAVLAQFMPGVDWFFEGNPLSEAGELIGLANRASVRELIFSDVRIPAPRQLLDPLGERLPERLYTPEPALSGLVVVDGPDPGGVLELRRGVYSLGRGEADLRIGDAKLSRRHALISVLPTSILLNDEGSANGVWFATRKVESCRLMIGDRFRAGNSAFEVVELHRDHGAAQDHAGVEGGFGSWPLEPVQVPGSPPTTRLAMLLTGALTPLVMGLGLFLVTHSVFFLAFSAVSILTGGLPALFIVRGKRKFARAQQLATAQDADRRADLAPLLGRVAAGLAHSSVVAKDGFPPLALGIAPLRPWLAHVSGNTTGDFLGKESSFKARAVQEAKTLKGAWKSGVSSRPSHTTSFPAVPGIHTPVLLRLTNAQSLVLEGEADAWAPLCRALVVRWLPMLRIGSLRLVIIDYADFLPSNLLLMDGVEVLEDSVGLSAESHISTIVIVGPAARINMQDQVQGPSSLDSMQPNHVAAADPAMAPRIWIFCGSAPTWLRAQARINARGALVLSHEAHQMNPWFAPAEQTVILQRGMSTVGRGVAMKPAKLSMEVLESAVAKYSVDAAMKNEVEPAMSPVLFEGTPDTAEVNEKSGIRTVIGDDAHGPVKLDFAAHGPHFLIAGTTGSGKSELLRSMILGLALEYGPAELAFMLVDFKGGATLAPLAELPQVQSFVSDLDAPAARRVLEQLACELRRRETIFAEYGASDHSNYLKIGAEDRPYLPILVVVIDEFRVFAAELPGALENIVQLATVGRSLGIHLVLSTQRPAGILNAQLRANISTVIALRTIGEFESNDLIGSSAAAHLDPGEPGLALMRCGGETPRKFRARLNARAADSLHLRAWGRNLGAPLWSQRLATDAFGQKLAVDQVPQTGQEAASEMVKLGSAAELEVRVSRILLRWAHFESAANPFSAQLPKTLRALPRSLLRGLSPGAIVLGMVDRVDAPRPDPLLFEPATCCRLAVCGLPGSGVESVPEVLVRSMNRDSWQLAGLVLDGDGNQEHLADVPGVRGYFGPRDTWRIDELLRQLEDSSGTGPMLLIVSGLAGWAQAMGPHAFQQFDTALGSYARSAAHNGRSLVLCGDKDLAGVRALALCETRWYFPCGAGPEVLMGWPKLKPITPTPGRGLIINSQGPQSGSEFQLLDPCALDNAELLSEPVPEHWIKNIKLPEVLSGSLLREQWNSRKEPHTPDSAGSLEPAVLGLPVGVSAPDHRLFYWNPGSIGIVVGRRGAGKHMLLRYLATSVPTQGCQIKIYGIEDSLPRTLEELGSTSVGLVLIERVDTRVSETLNILGPITAANIPLIISTEPSARLLFDLGLSSMVRDPGSFLVLDPRSTLDAEPADFRFAAQARSVRGRGLVFDGGTLRQIQCVNAV